jgi:hypothetical protein
MRELAGVLRVKLDWQESEIRVHLKLLAKVAEIISPAIALRVIEDDPADDRVLECAVAAQG